MTPTVSSSLSANRRCTLVAMSARATSLSLLRPPIDGVLSSPRTHIRPAHPVAVSSPLPPLSVEPTTYQLFLPCQGDTADVRHNTLANARRGVTVMSRLRASRGAAGRSECHRLSFPAFGSCQRTSAGRCCQPEDSVVSMPFPFTLSSSSSRRAVASCHRQGGVLRKWHCPSSSPLTV